MNRKLFACVLLVAFTAVAFSAPVLATDITITNNDGIYELSVTCNDGLTGTGFFMSEREAALAAIDYCEENSLQQE